MKKWSLRILVFLVALALVGCSAIQGTAAATTAGTGAAGAGGTAANQGSSALPQALQLLLGTMKLEETSIPVDAEQAASLLPLWKAFRSLGQSDTTATEEMTALVAQIQGTLTAEQQQAIQELGLSMQDMAAVGQELGIEIGFARGTAPDAGARATAQASGQSNQAPPAGFDGGGGGFPGDGGGPGGPPGASAGTFGQSQGSASNPGAGASIQGVNSDLLDAFIQFLESKLQ